MASSAALFVAGCVGEGSRPAPEETRAGPLEMGRELTEAFLAGDLEPLWNRMTLEMREAAGGSIREFGDFRNKVAELAGEEVEVLDEEVLREQGLQIYRRLSVFTKAEDPMVVQWAVARDGAVAEFFLRPEQPAAAVVYETKTELHLPFEGEWYVTAGGRTVEQNHHSLDYSNRFAYDLVSAEEFGRSQPGVSNDDFATAPGRGAAVRNSQERGSAFRRGAPRIPLHYARRTPKA